MVREIDNIRHRSKLLYHSTLEQSPPPPPPDPKTAATSFRKWGRCATLVQKQTGTLTKRPTYHVPGNCRQTGMMFCTAGCHAYDVNNQRRIGE